MNAAIIAMNELKYLRDIRTILSALRTLCNRIAAPRVLSIADRRNLAIIQSNNGKQSV